MRSGWGRRPSPSGPVAVWEANKRSRRFGSCSSIPWLRSQEVPRRAEPRAGAEALEERRGLRGSSRSPADAGPRGVPRRTSERRDVRAGLLDGIQATANESAQVRVRLAHPEAGQWPSAHWHRRPVRAAHRVPRCSCSATHGLTPEHLRTWLGESSTRRLSLMRAPRRVRPVLTRTLSSTTASSCRSVGMVIGSSSRDSIVIRIGLPYAISATARPG
jgi:hypothetical protein